MTYTLPEVCAVPSWSPCRFRDEGPVGGDLRGVPWPALGKARSEHARDPLSFPLGRVGPAVQPGAQFRQTNAEGLGGSPAAPPTAFELRAQPCSDGALEIPAVDLVEDPLEAFFTGLHIHPSAHDRSVLNLAPLRRQANVDGRGEDRDRRSPVDQIEGAAGKKHPLGRHPPSRMRAVSMERPPCCWVARR
jgi:hypothetical protein